MAAPRAEAVVHRLPAVALVAERRTAPRAAAVVAEGLDAAVPLAVPAAVLPEGRAVAPVLGEMPMAAVVMPERRAPTVMLEGRSRPPAVKAERRGMPPVVER